MPAGDQRPLQADGFVERQPLTCAPAFGLALGQMYGAQRLVFGDQTELGAQFWGQRVVDGVENLEHLTHASEDVPALQFGAGRIDRKEAALELRHC